MPILDALVMAVLGICLIMAVLFFFMLLIKLTSFLVTLYDRARQKNLEKKNKPAYAEGACGSLTLVDTSERDAALIMAITAERLKVPLNKLRFISIKLIGEEEI